MTELAPVLSRLGLSQYLQSLVDEGFDTWETVLEITESDLDALNVKLGHRRRLQREISDTRRLLAEEAAASPPRITPLEDINDDSGSFGRLEHPQTGGSGKRKYRRHPKPDENAPERPPSAYVIFSNKTREDLKPRNLSFTEIAKRVGEYWQVLIPDEKEPYETQAARAKERYNAELAKYKRTDSYREYCQYLADFKAKHSTSLQEGKRPRLHNEQSASTSSASTNSASDGLASSRTAITHGRRRVDSVSSIGQYAVAGGHPSLAGIPSSAMIGIPTARTGTLSPAPTSPTPLAGYGEPMPHTPLQAAPIYATFGDTAQASNNGLRSSSHALPRMFPVDDHEPKMTQGKLPPLNTKPVLTGIRKDLPPSDSRRSHHRPASLTHQDTSRSSLASGSSLSSQTSDVSTTSSYGVYTPMTPVEESRVQRSLPAPPSIPMSASIGGKVVDRIQAQSLQPHISTVSPSSFNPLHPPQPQYHSPSGSSGKAFPQEPDFSRKSTYSSRRYTPPAQYLAGTGPTRTTTGVVPLLVVLLAARPSIPS
ncbi:Sterile alpha motif/pointed domain [Lasallia pustulata]|uniref:Sterile alpha motif/pointed domain n=1 Tax=Lasallia pustulata TaxID=136370 RepID=A0A1W5D1C9_9LECA|nr:Sterile alpha motif/pointed domain [Lasallia pustulata]